MNINLIKVIVYMIIVILIMISAYKLLKIWYFKKNQIATEKKCVKNISVKPVYKDLKMNDSTKIWNIINILDYTVCE